LLKKEHYIKNKDKIRLYKRSWENSPRGKLICRKNSLNSRLKRLLWGGKPLTVKEVQQVYEANIKGFGKLTCYICLEPVEFGKDCLEHNIPLCRGGTNEFDNLGIAHESCNLRKGKMTLSEYQILQTKKQEVICQK
jgi:5-methylcytosine-specific restriction endonuclease McrA